MLLEAKDLDLDAILDKINRYYTSKKIMVSNSNSNNKYRTKQY